MEPAPLLNIELGATPAPQVELLDPGHDSGPAGAGLDPGLDPGLDVPLGAASSDEAPYLRLRTSADVSSMLTPTPMIDLTDLAVAMPTPPPFVSQISNPILPLRRLPARDPADETGVTPMPTPIRRSRVTLSRPRLAGLGVLAFSAGLLTAATAGVLARPAGMVSPATMARTAASATTTVTAPATTASGATAPVLAADEVAAPASPLPEAQAELEPAAAAPIANATLGAAAAPAAKTAAATTGKARGKGAAPVRGRARTTNRSRSGTRVDSGVGQGELAAPATEGASDEAKEAPPAAPSKREKERDKGANWVDPFAE